MLHSCIWEYTHIHTYMYVTTIKEAISLEAMAEGHIWEVLYGGKGMGNDVISKTKIKKYTQNTVIAEWP